MSPRVLVAEDEADIRRLIVFTLRRRGYDVLEAASGDAALDLARRERPDLAILDVMMPGLSGLEVTAALAAHPDTAAIPVIIASARGQVAEVAAGLRSGARSYLVKPFAPNELAARVAEVLGTHGHSQAGGSP